MTDTTARIRAVFADAGCRGWLQARPVECPTPIVDYRGAQPVVAASVYKLILLAAVGRSFDRGGLSPTARVTFSPTDCSPGPTGFSACSDPVTVSWRDLARSMITVSDNAAADMLLGVVGLAGIHEVIDDLALQSTRVVGGAATLDDRIIRDTGALSIDEAVGILSSSKAVDESSRYNPAFTTATSPADTNTLLSAIWTDTVASPAACRFMRGVLAQQIWPHRIRSGFPHQNIEVAGKTGTVNRVRNDVAVVTFPNETPVAVSVFTHAARDDKSLPIIDQAIGIAARIAVTAVRSGS